MESFSAAADSLGSGTLQLADSGTSRATLFVQLGVTAVLLFAAAIYARHERFYPGLPVVYLDNEKNIAKAKRDWSTRAGEIIKYGLDQVRKPFQVASPTGPRIILPNRYANVIKNHPDLSFAEWTAHEFLAHIKGFEGFGEVLRNGVFTDVVRMKLTQSLGSVTEDLCEESDAALREKLGGAKEWQDITLKPFILQFVAQLSTRIFLGPDLCRNEEWLEIVIRYTVEAFLGADELRRYPSWLRPLVSLYLPGPRRVRATIARANAILSPEIERRRARDAALEAQGVKVKGKDTVRWMDEVAKGRPFDVVISQLFFSVAALHTTSDLLTQAMFDLVTHPEVMDELREEVRRVIAADGWQKTSLYKMKLMDSFLKESQRVNHPSKLSMNRKAIENVTLSDGTFIPKGASVACSVERMSDPTVYPEPEKFDASRFLRMRERPGEENSWQFVTTSKDHLAFGHGTHACPGRFFASNEAKIALSHLLLMYDWKLPDGVTKRPETVWLASDGSADPTAKVSFRRRDENVPT